MKEPRTNSISISEWLTAADEQLPVSNKAKLLAESLVLDTEYVHCRYDRANEVIHASVIRKGDRRKNKSRHNDFSRRGAVDVSVFAEYAANGKSFLAAECSCQSRWDWTPQPCEHAGGVMADLVSLKELRDAVFENSVSRALLERLGAIRYAEVERFNDSHYFERWKSVKKAKSLELKYSVRVSASSQRAGFHGPSLQVSLGGNHDEIWQHAKVGDLSVFAPEDRELIAHLADGAYFGRIFRGPLAATVIGLLRGRNIVSDSGGVSFSDIELHPSIQRGVQTLGDVTIGMGGGGAFTPFEKAIEESDVAQPFRRLFRSLTDRPKKTIVPVLEGVWLGPDESVVHSITKSVAFLGTQSWVWFEDTATFHRVSGDVDQDILELIVSTPSIELSPKHHAQVADVLKGLSERSLSIPILEELSGKKETPSVSLRVDGTPLAIMAELIAHYSFGDILIGGGDSIDGAQSLPDVRRDPDCEKQAISRIGDTSLEAQQDGRWAASDEQAISFWQEHIRSLRESYETHKIEVVLSDRLSGVKIRRSINAKVTADLVNGWIQAGVELSVDDVRADLADVRRALQNNRRWVQLKDNTLARITDQAKNIIDDLTALGVEDDGSLRLPISQIGALDTIDPEGEIGLFEPRLIALRKQLGANVLSHEPQMPKKLKAILRDYQKTGLGWLQNLVNHSVGGILADDMGLGKTVMMLSLMSWDYEKHGKRPALVICPTSVASNWVRESEKFTPHFRTLLLHGAERHEKWDSVEKYQLLVTTYALMRRDIETLKKTTFRFIIFDEAQNLKNVDAQSAQVARELMSDFRFALTGTPIENRLRELWSIMDLCNSGMLGTDKQFINRYERPIMLSPGGQEAKRLKALVRPLILRRTKETVLSELPPKTEIEIDCVLDDKQRRRYDSVAHYYRQQVESRIKEVGLARSSITLFTALLRLRQTACDPRLLDARASAKSAKLTAFLELVDELVQEGRRALVFSQFVELLTLWKHSLDANNIAYEYLDGSTKNREAVVKRFQEGQAPLFLISLKAGGAGLNLTGADTVIHCDPWWNPAVEDQATDRAHRMGQTKAVTVYRLVAKGTVEERIMELKEKKRAVADAVLAEQSDEIGALTEAEVARLLADSDE